MSNYADYGYLMRSMLNELAAISGGTISISAGTMVVSVGTISTLNSGTLQYVGNIGTLPNVVVGSGTLQAITGDVPVIVQSGTLQTLNAGTIDTVSSGTLQYVGAIGTLPNIIVESGTLQMLNGGTINTINSGTLQYVGAIASGTLQAISQFQTDPVENAIVQIDTPHHQIHDGNYFNASTRVNGVATVEWFHLTVPSGGTHAHLAAEIESTDGALVEFFENPTVTWDGTAITINNKNRSSAGTSVCTAYHSGTVTADGTLLLQHVFGTGNPRTIIGGAVRSTAEWVLNSGHTYLWKITHVNAGTMTLNAEWYETNAA